MASKTTKEIADLYAQPAWLIRRIVDSLGEEIPRAGLYRLVPETMLDKVRDELQRRGYLVKGNRG